MHTIRAFFSNIGAHFFDFHKGAGEFSHHSGDILVNLRGRISDPQEKCARRNVLEIFWLETSKNDHSRGEGVRLQVPLSLSQCALLLPKNALLLPELPFYFPELPFYFPEMPFCFLELLFCFPKVSFCFPEVPFYFSKMPLCFPELHLSFPEVLSFYFLCASVSMSAFFQLI